MKLLLAILLSFAAAAGVAQNAAGPVTRFKTVDILVDSGATPLAAYQLEFKATNGNVKIVGVEGGEPAVFKEPPYYDPKAMQHERVIVAAFSVEPDAKLPHGKRRVASVHVQVIGDGDPGYAIALAVAADSVGRKIDARASVEERK